MSSSIRAPEKRQGNNQWVFRPLGYLFGVTTVPAVAAHIASMIDNKRLGIFGNTPPERSQLASGRCGTQGPRATVRPKYQCKYSKEEVGGSKETEHSTENLTDHSILKHRFRKPCHRGKEESQTL